MQDIKYIKRCFRLAQKGCGKTSPNPMVGCVILDKNNNLISEGYHKKYGENHAERNALENLSMEQTEGGTLYVNLEPCNHYGKTPPCTDIIIEKGIKRVVISNLDPNPKAKGGVEKLKNAGIEVTTGILEHAGRELNEIFFTNIEENRPYVALKCATTIDGKIATHTGDSKWITSTKARNYARKLRKKYDAILTTSTTIIADNPEMKHKTKIIIDREFKTNFDYKIYKQGKCILFTNANIVSPPNNVEIAPYKDLKTCLDEIYTRKIYSVFVEAGGNLLGSFVKENLFDKLYHFVAPKILNDNNGKSAFNGDDIKFINEAKQLEIRSLKKLSPDILIEYKNIKPFGI